MIEKDLKNNKNLNLLKSGDKKRVAYLALWSDLQKGIIKHLKFSVKINEKPVTLNE